MPLPELSPLIAYDLICRTCGVQMMRAVQKDQQGRAHKIVYYCKACDFWTESDQMTSGRQFPGKTSVIPIPEEPEEKAEKPAKQKAK